MRRKLPRFCALLAACAIAATSLAPREARAQVAANETWRTIRTRHFAVHFTPALEREARHAAMVAERAYANLATELAPPRGPIDIVVSDATDVSNGSATVIPRPRVVIYARPPVDEVSLESYDDWTVLVVQHELTHIFQLDRTRGWWSVGQSIFGRNPVLFPEYYTPSWLTEGLAVYYESRFTSGGRLEGTYQSAVARAAAIDHRAPSIDELSLATSRFPYGQSAYVYGSFIWDQLARDAGPASVRRFLESSSAATIPFLLDREAKRAFGETFSSAWRKWRDSVLRSVNDSATRSIASDSAPLAPRSAYVVPRGGRDILYPRWRDDSTFVYAADDGRDEIGMFEGVVGREPRRVARRNSLDVNAPLRGGIVYSQGDYVDRFHVRGDLYYDHDGITERLTNAARAASPDARPDGRVVFVHTVPGGTRLGFYDERSRRMIAEPELADSGDWTAARWAPTGNRVAAIMVNRGMNWLVVYDLESGARVRPVLASRAVLRSPAWMPDGRSMLFTSDITGASQLYMVDLATPESIRRLTSEPGGVFGADVIAHGADSIRVVTTALRGDGYHVLVWTASNAALHGQQLEQNRTPPSPDRWNVADDTSRSTPYSPWRTLAPAYWSPTFAQEGGGRGSLVGALTGASDVIGRHAYVAQASVNTHNGNVDASLSYAYLRWTNPTLSVSAEQSYSYASIFGSGVRVGDLDRRIRFGSLHATFQRPRARTYSSFTVGAEIEQRDYGTDPPALLARLDPFYSTTHTLPTLLAAATFSNVQRPTLSISPEDGVSLTSVFRQRWESGQGAAGRSVVAVANGYKSLDLPGFAHHVFALRLAAGGADNRSTSTYDVGGVSGTSFEIVPGISFGSSTRTFPVRGFPAGTESGIYATAASAEYRIPLAAPSRGVGLFPFFLDRASLALFGDAGRSRCPASATPACSGADPSPPVLSSLGGELDLDSALQFDVPYRFRLGVAVPVHGRVYAGASSASAYLTIGATF